MHKKQHRLTYVFEAYLSGGIFELSRGQTSIVFAETYQKICSGKNSNVVIIKLENICSEICLKYVFHMLWFNPNMLWLCIQICSNSHKYTQLTQVIGILFLIGQFECSRCIFMNMFCSKYASLLPALWYVWNMQHISVVSLFKFPATQICFKCAKCVLCFIA